MDCVIPGSNIKPLAKAIHTLSKLADEVYFEAQKECLVLSAVNFENTEHGCFKVLPPFFRTYELHPPLTEEQTPTDAMGVKLRAKPFSKAFKSGNISEKRLESCSISLGANPTKIKIVFAYKNKVTRMVHIWLVEGDEVLQVKPVDALASNKIVACSAFLTGALSNFRRSDPEITVIATPAEMVLQNYLEDDEVRYNAVRSQLSLGPKKFSVYRILCDATVTFSNRAFRAVVQFANSMHREVTMIFKMTGSPLEIHVGNSNTFEARFILATLQEPDSQSEQSDATSMDLCIPYCVPGQRPEPNNGLVPTKVLEENNGLDPTRLSEANNELVPTRLSEENNGLVLARLSEENNELVPTRLSEENNGLVLARLTEANNGLVPARLSEENNGLVLARLSEANNELVPTKLPEENFAFPMRHSEGQQKPHSGRLSLLTPDVVPPEQNKISELLFTEDTALEVIPRQTGPCAAPEGDAGTVAAGQRIPDSEPVEVDETPLEDIPRYPYSNKVLKGNTQKPFAEKMVCASERVENTPLGGIFRLPGSSKTPAADAGRVLAKKRIPDSEPDVVEDTPVEDLPVFPRFCRGPKGNTKVVKDKRIPDSAPVVVDETPLEDSLRYPDPSKVLKINTGRILAKKRIPAGQPIVVEDTPVEDIPRYPERSKVRRVNAGRILPRNWVPAGEPIVVEDTPPEDILRYPVSSTAQRADPSKVLAEKSNQHLPEQNDEDSPDIIEATPPEDLKPCVRPCRLRKGATRTDKRPAEDSPETPQQKRVRFVFQRCWDTTYKGLVASDEEILAEDSDPECEAVSD